jgi:hypothetical protein
VKIMEAAAELARTLSSAGIAVVGPSGRLTAPAVLIVEADPFLTRSSVIRGGRVVSWRLELLAGVGDTAGIHGQLWDLIELVSDALAAEPGWSSGDVGGPRMLDVSGQLYLAAQMTVARHATITAEG